MNKYFTVFFLGLLLTPEILTGADDAPKKSFNENNVDASGLMLKGFDPVSYFNAPQPQKGSDKFQLNQNGSVFWFSSNENKELFKKNPALYTPQFGGWCAYAVADSKSKVDVDPLNFVIQDQKLLLFYKSFWTDTRDKWLHSQDKNSTTYLQEAQKNWPLIKETAP
jgi:YHS domain-containing protein